MAVVILCMITITTLVGCSNKPSGFPKTYPTTVTVKDGGAPLADITVFLDSESPAEWVISGVTDSQGVAKINTKQVAYKSEGAPTGNFTVRVDQKCAPLPPDLADIAAQASANSAEVSSADAEKIVAYMAANKIFPDRYTSASMSPVKISVSASGGNVEFDIQD
ncbi:MAG: hypothetical protein ACRC2T_01785 [Thermoguttaceae bacterium]